MCAALAPLGIAQEAPKPDAKAPEVKVDSAQLPPQVGGRVATFAPVVEKVAPSVVTIATSKMMKRNRNPYFNDPMFRRFFGLPEPDEEDDGSKPQQRGGAGKKHLERMGLGSGVIVAPEGYVLTNNHVIEGADEIIVTLAKDKKEYKAKKIGNDPATDVAVLKIDAQNLPAITFADSAKVRVGDLVLAVGNPFGLTQSVTMGIVSALGRSGVEPRMGAPGDTHYEDFIQTDASINPGNSGGALVDAEGRLIGINTAIFSLTGGNQGIGFAVPANLAHGVMDSLIKTGHVSRGFLGIGLQPLTDDLAKQFKLESTNGALVSEVQPKSPAEKAGIETGDVVIEVNGKKVEDPRELQMFVAGLAPNSNAEVKIWRDGKEKTVSVMLAERPTQKVASANEENKPEEPDVLDGVTVGELDSDARKQFEIPESIRNGVVVMKVDGESPSAEAGIRAGDVILEINRQGVKNAKQAVDLSEKLKKEKKVLLRVAGKGGSRYVVVERKD
ncbi:MAG TPA: Do family serine endopeptidase [Chthoniobacteraceae bacterium]|nr:Do family serine endopeptidase [Chthoniobacteraceae bacterium]